MNKAERIEDARERLDAEESRLKESDCAGAMYEAQRCIELSVKALLDKLNINYKTKEGRIPHDVSDKVSETFEKLKPYLEDYEVDSARVGLARSALLLRFLTSIREYLEFGVGDLAGSKETFNSLFAKTLASTVVESVRDSPLEGLSSNFQSEEIVVIASSVLRLS